MTGPTPQLSHTDGVLNALLDPWVPVVDLDGQRSRLGVAEVLTSAHRLRGLAPGLSPLERDALTRLLISLTGLALRLDGVEPEDTLTEIPPGGVQALAEAFVHLFWLRHPTRPFCQEWDRPQDDANTAIRDLAYLDPQTPGSSSSQWGVSGGGVAAKSAAIAGDLARLMLLTLVAWWHTKHSNARDGYGRKFEYGAPGDIGVRTLGAYMTHRSSLAMTLTANVPCQWLDSDSVPAYLSQDPCPGAPSDETLAREPLDLWRTTYARNTPLIHWHERDGRWVPTGYVLGPSTRRVPRITGTAPDSLKAMHAYDPSRLFVTSLKKDGSVDMKPVSALDVRLSSTEGFMRWYQSHLAGSLAEWRGRVSPCAAVDETDNWSIAAFAEICDTQGNRKWLDYAVVPRRRLEAPATTPDGAPGAPTLLAVAAELRKALNGPLRLAAENRTRAEGAPALRAQTERALLAALEEPLVLALDSYDQPGFGARPVADEMRGIAVTVFDAATEPLATSTGIAAVAAARNRYRYASAAAVEGVFNPTPTGARSKSRRTQRRREMS